MNEEKKDNQQNKNKSFNRNNKRRNRNKTRDRKDPQGKRIDMEQNQNFPEKNDWSFYAASEQIAKDVASIPFNYIPGTNFKVNGTLTPDGGSPVNYPTASLFSVMGLPYINSIGVTNNRTQGANMAAVQLYTFIRHANSGARNYEAADVMMYILEMRDVYAEFFALKKILGIASLYNYYNHNLPDTLLASEYINAQDLRNNLAQYRGRLNILAKKINSFAVPKYFKIFDRTTYINSFIFADSDSIRGQFYNFVRAGYYTWSGITSTKGTELQFTSYYTNNSATRSTITYGDRLNILENMLDSMFLDEDALTMSGDILKAFGTSDLYQIADTDENYIVEIKFDEDILSQIENSTTFGTTVQPSNGTKLGLSVLTPDSDWKLNVTQNNQIITFEPSWQAAFGEDTANSVTLTSYAFNSHKSEPDYKDVLEWTRLMSDVSITNSTATGIGATVNSCGLELICCYSIFRTDVNTEVTQVQHYTTLVNFYGVNEKIIDLSQFDWHPIMYIYNGMPTSADESPIKIYGDLKVATIINNNVLDQINETAVYGALYGSGLYNSNVNSRV